MKIEKNQIRLNKCSYNVDGKYWYRPEILNQYTWYVPYAVNYKTLSTKYWLTSISPKNDYELKKFLKECLSDINKYIEMCDWKIVNRIEYDRIYELARIKRENNNKYVYL